MGSIWKQLEGYGIDPEPVFKEAGIDPDLLYDSGARISVQQFHDLEAKAIELSKDPHFGLTNAHFARPAHLGALGFAWLASSSLRTAFQRLSRYAKVIQENLAVDLDEDEEIVFGKSTYGSFTQEGCTDFDSVCLMGIGGEGIDLDAEVFAGAPLDSDDEGLGA